MRVQLGNDWLSFDLKGASASGTAAGATQTYPDALPGVTVSYTAASDAVKETLTLRSRSAPASFSFSLRTSGLTARANERGGIDFVDGSGAVPFQIAPAYMRDAAGALSREVRLELAEERGGYALTLAADPAWLRDPRRVYPVEIDPSLTMMGAWRDCFLASATPTKQLLHARQRPRRRGRRRRRAPGAARLRHRELRRAP